MINYLQIRSYARFALIRSHARIINHTLIDINIDIDQCVMRYALFIIIINFILFQIEIGQIHNECNWANS